jgi:DNA-binding transcriptional regulator YdaS (Cro superfamily)
MTLHEYLCRSRMDDKDFREIQFAKQLGIDPTHLSRLKKGKHRPGVDLAIAIEKATSGKVKAVELLKIKGDY